MKERPNLGLLGSLVVLVVVMASGLLLRYALRDFTTPDAFAYLLPWYENAHHRGFAALGSQFTNYTPFYSYLLILATQLDGIAKPLLLIKGVSFAFEFGSAVLAYRLVSFATESRVRSVIAFSGAWLAPTVLFNGAAWGQADAIWTFFVLLAVSRVCQGGLGALPFALAVSVKAQGVFLGPFMLGVLVRRRQWLWLIAVPCAYVVLALPVVLAGGSLETVLLVYLDQANTFRSLSVNAANLWLLVPNRFYGAGLAVGLLAAGTVALALARSITSSDRSSSEFLLLAACASLQVMPFLLPKMHDRYFYAFELLSIPLACIGPRYTVLAVMAQVNGVLSYMAFSRSALSFGLLSAALSNAVLAVFLLEEVRRGSVEARFPMRQFVTYVGMCTVFASLLTLWQDDSSTAPMHSLFALSLLVPLQAWMMLKQTAIRRAQVRMDGRDCETVSAAGSPVERRRLHKSTRDADHARGRRFQWIARQPAVGTMPAGSARSKVAKRP